MLDYHVFEFIITVTVTYSEQLKSENGLYPRYVSENGPGPRYVERIKTVR